MALELTPSKLELNIESSPCRAFEQYLSLVNPIVPDRLRPLELKVLARMMYYNFVNGNLPERERNLLLFSREIKGRIGRNLKVGRDSIDNVISSLYRKGYLSRDRKLKVRVPCDPDGRINLIYRIRVTDERDVELETPIGNDKDTEEGL